jgi:putative polysaccharide biosynthesis protein
MAEISTTHLGDERVPRVRDVLRADIGGLRRGFRGRRGRSSRIFGVLAALLDDKRGSRYDMRIVYWPPPSLLWSFLPGDGSTASFLHKFYVREVWRERGLAARLRLLAALLVWPFVTIATIGWFTWLNGEAIESRSGKKVRRQIAEQLHVATAHSIPPPWYYMFELFDDDKRARAGEYLNRFEVKGGLFRLPKRAPRGIARAPLGDKLGFAERCRQRGIPTASILLTGGTGSLPPGTGADELLPDADLFVKPLTGRGGFGAERWRSLGGARWSDEQDRVLTAPELIEHVERDFLPDGCVVQRRLANHRDIADLSNGVLSTVRIVTIENERGEHEATHAVLRMAIGKDSTVDNFHAGGIAAKVDLDTGVLGRATDIGLRPDVGWREDHPDNHARIAGRTLPYWPETVELARRAHAAFADRIVIGWDIAILDDGPAVIEGNSGPDLDIIQRTHGTPLGSSRLGELLAHHLRRALQSRDDLGDRVEDARSIA